MVSLKSSDKGISGLAHFALALLLALLLTGLQFASNYDYIGNCNFVLAQSASPSDQGNINFLGVPISFASLLGPAVLLAVFVAAIVYMVSRFVQNPQLEVFAKEELAQVIIAIVFMLFLGTMFLGACNLVENITTPPGDPFTKINNYMDYLISQGDHISLTLLVQSYENQLSATKYIYKGTPFSGGSGKAPNADRKTYASLQEINFDLLIPAMVSLKVQQWVLATIQAISITYILPMAIIMRLIPGLRGVSDYLMAMTFGLYVVVPLTYVLNTQIAFGNGTGSGVITGDVGFVNPLVDFGNIAALYPQAVFFPNITLVIFVASVTAMAKALQNSGSVLESYASFLERYV